MQTLSIYLLEISVTLMGVGHRKTGFDIYLLLSLDFKQDQKHLFGSEKVIMTQ